jgi:hypothetical protein
LSLNILIETKGRNYTPAEHGAWLGELGFRDIRIVWWLSLKSSAMSTCKPGRRRKL